jgi:hypothetical protein
MMRMINRKQPLVDRRARKNEHAEVLRVDLYTHTHTHTHTYIYI